MQIGLRHFGAQSIALVVAASEEPGATRCGLARLLCELSDWKDSKGRLALASARKVLPKVAAKAGFRLPEARPGVPDAAARVSAPDGLEAISALRCGIRDLGSLSLERVSEGDDRRCWEAMLEAWHPLGWKRAPGGQLRYWIRSSAYGVLGGIGFAAASWHQKARDEWIGWSADARAAHLGLVLCNHRFLLLPRIHGDRLRTRMIDSSTVRAHRHAAGSRRDGTAREMRRSRGGLTTKIHALIDGRGGPRCLHLSPGQVADCAEAAALLGRLGSGMKLVGDKAYDTNEILGLVAEAGGIAVIPSRSNRKEPRPIDSTAYATRSLIERFFGRIKEFRRVATRYDKRARNFLATVMLAATRYLLRDFARNKIATTA